MSGLKADRIKRIFLAVICAALFIPFSQSVLEYAEEKPLAGNAAKKEKVKFNFERWFSGEFQESYEAWYNQNFGLQPAAVRANNQLLYSLFQYSKANEVIVGKNGHLFYQNYIYEYTGRLYASADRINVFAERLKKLQDTLQQQGVLLVTILAPGPAGYFPEDIPDKYGKESSNSVYSRLVRLSKNGINLLDFNKWFRQMKSSSKYPLFSHKGTHWSKYSITMVSDSLLRYFSQKTKIEFPKVKIEKINLADTMRSPDDDIYSVANLLLPGKKETMAYPDFSYSGGKKSEPVRMLAVGDSYFDVLYRHANLAPACFDRIDFLPYYYEAYHSDGTPDSPVKDLNLLEELTSHRVIVLMATETNYNGFFWGFVDEAYRAFYEPWELTEDNAKLRKYKARVSKDPLWFGALMKDAEKRKVSFEIPLTETALELHNESETPISLSPQSKPADKEAFKMFANKKFSIRLAKDPSLGLSVRENKEIYLEKIPPGNSEIFTVNVSASGDIMLLSSAKKFVSTDHNREDKLIADRDACGTWEKFSAVKIDGDKFALKSDNGKFISVRPDGTVAADKSSAGDSEIFVLTQQ